MSVFLGSAREVTQFIFTETFHDDFQRVDENPLSDGGKWVAISAVDFNSDLVFNPLELISHAAHAPAYGGSGNATTADLVAGDFAADQYAEITIGDVGDLGLQAVLRGKQTAEMYFAFYQPPLFGSSILFIAYQNPSVPISIALAQKNILINTGDKLRFAVLGSLLKIFVNGVEVLSASDSRLSSGSPGVGIRESVHGLSSDTITDFRAGEVFAAPDQTDVFLGTVTVIDAAPVGASNPYLGQIKSGSPAVGQSNPSLGTVVIVNSAPVGESDPFLGIVQKA